MKVFVLILFSAQCAFAKITVHDYVSKFVDDYKPSDSIDANKAYILKYEFLYSKELTASYYSGDSSERESALEDLNEYAKQLPVLIPGYRNKMIEIRSIVEAVDEKFKSTFKTELDAHVYLFTELQGTDARAEGPLPQSFSLNLRVVSNYSKETLQVLIAHELFHLLQDKLQANEPQPGKIDGPLFGEGWATFASSLVFPGLPDWKYISYFKSDDAQYKLFQRDKKVIIQSMLDNWDSKDARISERYFRGGKAASTPWEPRNGYFIGYLAAKEMAKKSDSDHVAKMKYREFRKRIKSILLDIQTND